MTIEIWKYILQPEGYKSFIPHTFPPDEWFTFSPEIVKKASVATLLLGKLDGITQLLPDVDFFLFMYIRKDASSSSQIEGTMATMIDAIEAEAKTSNDLPPDVDDILHYINALNYGIERLKEFPMCLRVIREIHKELMSNARATHFSDPWNFRVTQNWIGWTSPSSARFVPPTVHEMNRSLSDLEKFLHNNNPVLPIIKAWLIHAQFETIHPFLDWNGRTWRMLITLFLRLEKMLEKPVLFLSSYFIKHQKIYYESLDYYHNDNVEAWLDFFLDGIIETSQEAIETVKKITILREEDMWKIQCLSKNVSETSMKILKELYKLPIVNVSKIQEWTWFTRQWAQKTIDRFIEMWILFQKDEDKNYWKSYIYKAYVDIF